MSEEWEKYAQATFRKVKRLARRHDIPSDLVLIADDFEKAYLEFIGRRNAPIRYAFIDEMIRTQNERTP